MSRLRNVQAGVLAMVALGAFAGLLFWDAYSLELAVDTVAFSSAIEDTNGTFVLTRMIVEPGEVVRIQLPGEASMPWGPWRLHVVEGGEAEALRRGEEPAHNYSYVENFHGDGAVLDLRRPLIPMEKVPPETLGWTATDSERFHPSGSFDPALTLDVVWVRPVPGAPCVDEPEACQEAAAYELQALSRTPHDNPRVTALDPVRVDRQGLFYTAEAATALFAVGAGGLALRRGARSVARVESASETELLLRTTAKAEQYLTGLRNTILGIGIVLVFLGLFGTLGMEELAFYIAFFQHSRTWYWVIVGGFVLAFWALVAGWAVALGLVQVELVRFRRALRELPLSLSSREQAEVAPASRER